MSKFYSKVLLFGEYAILEGSEALASPIHDFYGFWSKDDLKTDFQYFEIEIKAFAEHIEKLIDNKIISFDVEGLLKFWDEGHRFHTNIPLGYGLGSSGAFTASVYEKFGALDHSSMSPHKVKRHLALLESYFHGESSGMDPTISLYNTVIHSEEDWRFVKKDIFDPIKDHGLRFFLFDSQESRSSKNLISKFKTLSINPEFRENVLKPISKLNQEAIAYTLSGSKNLWESFDAISRLQLQRFDQMILDEVEEIWAKTIVEEAPHRLKLCGAGGGGYYLGLSNNIDDTLRALRVDRVVLL